MIENIKTEQLPTEFHVTRAEASALTDPKLWQWIKRGLLEIKRKNPAASAHWLPEHVRAEIIKGSVGQSTAELYLCWQGPKLQGFYVTLAQSDPFVNLPLTFFIWLTYGEGRIIDEAFPYIEKIARERGFTAIEGQTGRPGYARRLRKYGFKPVQYLLRKDLEE